MAVSAISSLQLQQVPRTDRLEREFFQSNYLRPRNPVVLTRLAENWPARHRWTPEFFQTNYGDRLVKVYDASFAAPGQKYMSSLKEMRLKDYLEKVLHDSRDLRMFLYNMPTEIPELRNDVMLPSIADGFSKRFMFLFFGCRGSVTPIHYDIDMSHVFHTALHGRKRIILFSQTESKRLYQHPLTVRSYVDVEEPDFLRFPHLDEARGWTVTLEPGETLFIPSGFWHHVYYEEGGYAISLRCRNEHPLEWLQGWFNLLLVSPIDRVMNQLMADRWFTWKEAKAASRANQMISPR